MKKRHLARPDAPRLPYPFFLLSDQQRMFLYALRREEVRTIGQAFAAAGIDRLYGHAAIERWLNIVAFEKALFVTVNSMSRIRRDQVFDTICAFVRRQPIHKICNVPRPRSMKNSGWHSHRFTLARGRRRTQPTPIFSESGEDPWK